MNVLGFFDPWNSPLCTCSRKYSLSPYTGCSHACRYCYITSYIPSPFISRAKKNFLNRLRNDIAQMDSDLHISLSNSSDPYTPPEIDSQLTRQTLRLLLDSRLKAQLITKSSLVTRDIDILEKGNFTVSITLTTLDTEKASKLEPFAPPPQDRLDALRKLASRGIPCSVRIDPILLGINDKDLCKLVDAISKAGAKHVVSSTYKARQDSFNRVLVAFPELKELLTQAYMIEGEIHGRLYYLSREIRENILKGLKDLVEDLDMTYGICREGLGNLNSGATCDGSHLIPLRIVK